MKITTSNDNKATFQPISFTINIESKRELELWACIMNGSLTNLSKYANRNKVVISMKNVEDFDGDELVEMMEDQKYDLFNTLIDHA